MLHSHVRKNSLFHRGHIRSASVAALPVHCVCVWMSGKVRSVLLCSNMWTCVCCCPLHPVCECMTDRCQACHSNPGCCGWDVWGEWEMEAVEERDGERVCHFTQAFLFYDTHPQPRIVYQYQQMTDKGTAQLQTDTHRDCVYACVCVCVFELSWMNAGVDALKTMACPHFARSAYPHILAVMMRPCSMCTKHQTTVPAAFLLPSPLCTCFSLTIKMLTAFQKLDFTNGKTASAFLQLHIWQP